VLKLKTSIVYLNGYIFATTNKNKYYEKSEIILAIITVSIIVAVYLLSLAHR
jgi:hypothetical protein